MSDFAILQLRSWFRGAFFCCSLLPILWQLWKPITIIIATLTAVNVKCFWSCDSVRTSFPFFSFFFSIALGFGFVLFLCMCVVSGCAMLITTRKHFMDLLHWIRETKNNKESNSSIWNWQKLFWSDRKSLWRRYGSYFCCFSMNPTRASCTICTSYCRIEIVFIAYIIFNWCGLDKLLLHSHCHLRCYIFMAQWWCLQCFRHRTKSSEGRSHLLFCNDVIFTATLVLFQFPRLTRSSFFCLPAFTSCTNTHTHTYVQRRLAAIVWETFTKPKIKDNELSSMGKNNHFDNRRRS